jgi:protein ImuA
MHVQRLRQKLALAERPSGVRKEDNFLSLGIAAIDDALGGGIASGVLHEIAAKRETEIAVATGFSLAIASIFYRNLQMQLSGIGSDKCLLGKGYVLWISENLALCENGEPYAVGVDQAGIAPERLITVAACHGRDALWAMEEALRCRAVGVVIGEIRARRTDPIATRRLSLAAATGGALGILLRTTSNDEPSAVATRWIIGASPPCVAFRQRSRGIAPASLAVRLVRNRRGPLGEWIVEWNCVEQRFELATHSELMAGTALDRPLREAVA